MGTLLLSHNCEVLPQAYPKGDAPYKMLES